MFCLKLRECLIPLRCHIQYVSDLFREDPGDDQVTWSPTVSQNDKKLRVTENLNFWDILEKTISDRIKIYPGEPKLDVIIRANPA